jgi:hypothetical protein
MSDFKRTGRARSLLSPEAPCLARRARCDLSLGCVSLRPRHLRRRATRPTSDPLGRLLDIARGLAARFWALID